MPLGVLGELGDRIVATIVALAGFTMALAVLFRYPPLKWVAHSVRDSVIEAHQKATTDAVNAILENGNPISKKIEAAADRVAGASDANREVLMEESQAIRAELAAHVVEDRGQFAEGRRRFDRIENALGVNPTAQDPENRPGRPPPV